MFCCDSGHWSFSVFCQSVPELCHNTEPSDHNLTKKKIMKKKLRKKNTTTTTKFDEAILEKIDDDDDFLVALNESD